MKDRVFVLLMILGLTCISVVSTNILPVMAQERKVGVKAGDWATYNITLWNSSGVITEWVLLNMTITSVHPPYALDWGQVISWSNGTEHRTNGTASVLGSDDPTQSMIGWFISADLYAGDLVYEFAYLQWGEDATINKTITWNYPSGPREVNYLNITYEPGPKFLLNYYWDRLTGIPVRYVQEDLTRNKGEGGQYEILDTNINGWIVSDSTLPSISIMSPENKTYNTANIQLTFTIDESVSWIAYSLNGQANMTITGNTTLSGLSDGSHSLIVYTKDTSGNLGSSEIVFFAIETKQPAVPWQLWIIVAIVIIAVVGTIFLVYFTKIKRTTERVKQSNVKYLSIHVL